MSNKVKYASPLHSSTSLIEIYLKGMLVRIQNYIYTGLLIAASLYGHKAENDQLPTNFKMGLIE